MPLFVRTTGHYDKKKEISCHDCFRENSLQRSAAALTRRVTYSCDRRTSDGMELLFIRIFAVKGGRPAALRRQGENMKKNTGKI